MDGLLAAGAAIGQRIGVGPTSVMSSGIGACSSSSSDGMRSPGASAGIPGTFVYTPAAGVVLTAGSPKILSVTFTPTDATIALTKASESVGVKR